MPLKVKLENIFKIRFRGAMMLEALVATLLISSCFISATIILTKMYKATPLKQKVQLYLLTKASLNGVAPSDSLSPNTILTQQQKKDSINHLLKTTYIVKVDNRSIVQLKTITYP